MMDWDKFFKEHKDYTVLSSFYENRRDFSLEELYQAFKERIKAEMVVDVHGTSHYGVLINRFDGDGER